MKKVVALTAGFLVALAPAGTAVAGEPGGNAWGNCKNSASGGKTVLAGSTLKNDSGLGGFAKHADCEPAPAAPVPGPVDPAPGNGDSPLTPVVGMN